jgi:hypothetical protein
MAFSTVRYLGIEVGDAIEIEEKIDIQSPTRILRERTRLAALTASPIAVPTMSPCGIERKKQAEPTLQDPAR